MTNYISIINNVKKRHEKSNVANQDGGKNNSAMLESWLERKMAGTFERTTLIAKASFNKS